MSGKVIVLSGGLDSSILAYKIKNENPTDDIYALTFNYGQRHSIEIEKAKITCSKLDIVHTIIDISFMDMLVSKVTALSSTKQVAMPTIKDVLGQPQPISYWPYRNLLLTSMAMTFAESNKADEVYLGLQSVDEYSYWDTSPAFVKALNDISNLNRLNKVEIKAPFVNMTKKDEILIGLTLNVPFEDTWTCYSGEDGHGACGTCPSCAERIMNFAKAGLKDPCNYVKQIDWDKLIEKNKVS